MGEEINQNKILTVLTIFSTFLMGFIDAYTFITQDGLFASAQTGNMVVLGAKLFEGDFMEALIHVFSFVGFAVGAFAAQGIIEHFKDYGWRKYRIYLFLQMLFFLSSLAFSIISALLSLDFCSDYWQGMN